MLKVAVVVPTVYSRPDYLAMSINSIQSQVGKFEMATVVVCPENKVSEVSAAMTGLLVLPETRDGGLAHKLSQALMSVARESDYVAWLGDDDLLEPNAVESALEKFSADPNIVMTFGGCHYIDSKGKRLGTNHSGQWAATFLPFGPQLIPQPGSIMKSSAFLESGGLSDEFALAFDFDLFLKLQKIGKLSHLGRAVASFRWHPDSLSVKRRMVSALEASRVRLSHYNKFVMLFSWIWEPVVILLTWLAGKLVSVRARRQNAT